MESLRLGLQGSPRQKTELLRTIFSFPFSIFPSASVADPALGGLIALASENLIFQLLTFLVRDRQRAAVGSDEFHFDFVELAILSAAGRCKGKTVLVAEESGDAAEDVRNLAVELREPSVSSGFLSKRAKLIFGLQIIHVRAEIPARFKKVRPGLAQAYAKDRHIASAKRFHRLIKSVLRERVHAAGKQENGFLPYHVLEPFGCLDQRIENVGFAETGEVKVIDGIADFVLVLCEVHLDAGFHVESFESHPIFCLQIGEQGVGPVSGVCGKPAVSISAELHQHHHGDRRFGRPKIGDGLRYALIENAEIFLFKVGNKIAVLRSRDDVESHNRDIYTDADVGLWWLLPGGRSLRRRGLLLLLRRRRPALRAGGRLSAGRLLRERHGHNQSKG